MPWPGNVSIYVGPNSCKPDPANPQLAPGLSTTYQLQVSASPLLLAHIGAIKDLIGKDASALGLVPCAGVTTPSADPCETRASSGHARRVTALSAGPTKRVCKPARLRVGKATVVKTGTPKGVTGVAAEIFGGREILVSVQTRLRKLKGESRRLRSQCAILLATTFITGDDGGVDGAAFAVFGIACVEALKELDRQIVEELRSVQARDATAAAKCRTLIARFEGSKRNRLRMTRVAKSDPKSPVRVSCKATAQGSKITVRTRGKRSLRSALGKKLTLHLLAASVGPAPKPGEKIAVAFTFFGKAK